MKGNRFEVAENVAKRIAELEERKRMGYRGRWLRLRIADVCEELSIFDWWNEELSLSQLKQMQKFLKVAEQLGFNGYVCFKVGAAGCSHGMWAHREESKDGYSPDGVTLHHSFRSGDNYWDCKTEDGKWLTDKDENGRWQFTLAEVKDALNA